AFDETVTDLNVAHVIAAFATGTDGGGRRSGGATLRSDKSFLPESLVRTTPFCTHPVFNTHHSETEMLRYLKRPEDRDLSPQSAHGTNPASAVMAGMQVVVVKTDPQGNIDVADLEAKAQEHRATLGALMVTYPSTHGVFEASIKQICRIVHDNGGQVYMDGAN